MATPLKQNLAIVFFCLLAASAAFGQSVAPELNITLGEQRVRFTPTRSFQEMRLEVVNSVGEIVFTHLTTEAEFDWNLRAGNSEALAPGLYRYTLALKFGEDQSRRHTGHFIVEKTQDQIWLTASDGTEVSGTVLNAARSGRRSITGLGSKDDKSVKRDVSGRDIVNEKGDDQGNKLTGSTKAVKAALLGTANMVPKYDVGGVNLIDSAITESGGNVGIGVTTPGSILEMFRTGPSEVVFRMGNSTRLWSVGVNGSGDFWRIRDNTAGAARLVVAGGTGNIGIGTLTPAAKFDIIGDLRSSALRQELTASSPNVINGFMGTGSGGATPGNRVTAGVVGASIGGGGFNDGVSNFSNRVTDNFGTVGGGRSNQAGDDSGTVSNREFATVGGGRGNIASSDHATVGGGEFNTANGPYATVGGGSSNIASNQDATVSGGQANTASGGFATVPGGADNTASGNYSFAAGRRAKANHQGAFVWADFTFADFASTAANQFLIRAGGNVGINTTTPTATLEVNGSIKLGGPGDLTGPIGLSPHSGTGDFKFFAGLPGGGIRRMTILNDGKVGIGTDAPDLLLSVNGDASKTGGTSWAVFSDERLKNIRGKYTPGLRALMKLQPIRFEYKADNALGLKGTGETVGFSAQAVAAVLPEAVTQSESGYLQLNSDPILWTMLNSIKEQQAEIQRLQRRLMQLERRGKTRRR